MDITYVTKQLSMLTRTVTLKRGSFSTGLISKEPGEKALPIHQSFSKGPVLMSPSLLLVGIFKLLGPDTPLNHADRGVLNQDASSDTGMGFSRQGAFPPNSPSLPF